MIVPWQQLNPDTLESILEEFIMREGTDYGEYEVSLDDKKSQLQEQLRRGDIVLVYSELHETVNLMPASEFKG
ncbi:YheU family protein [Psychrosphaera ytuae]|uniref:UPF0270 protein J1N51_08780 n=1 Tax=Psychrosphaera ytuae TaxID=2820710 RepID=A0A975DAS5_9GAMM|nr:YheU family protein [Psychrosphaera ytuae]QTH62861.1 YheU family protein [Psychrosphaera ytuae]